MLWRTILAIIAASLPQVHSTPAVRHYDSYNYYALEHQTDSKIPLTDVADALGVEVVEQAGELEDVWLVRAPKTDGNLDRREGLDSVLATFESLKTKASSVLGSRSEDTIYARNVVSSVRFLELQAPQELVKRAPPPVRPPSPTSALGVANRLGLKDPLFPEQWHLVNDDFPEHMMNTTPVWDMGFTGKGVLTSFLDDGLDFETDDLKDAFVSISVLHSFEYYAHDH